MKISKILVPIDFSPTSINALRYAVTFAKSSGASISIIHVTEPDSLVNDIKGNLSPDHLLDLLKAEPFLNGVELTSVFREGNIVNLILDEAKKSDIDLIIIGTRGTGTISRTLFGSNTTKVIRKAHCAVLSVPDEASYTPIRKVILAIDLEHRADKLIEQIINLVKLQQSAILLLYVGIDSDGRFERQLEELTAHLKLQTSYKKILCKVIPSNEFHESLESLSSDIEANMLVMITHHRAIMESIFDPSQTQLYAFHTHLPLLVIPQHIQPVFFLV